MIKEIEGGETATSDSELKYYISTSSPIVTIFLISLLSFFGAEILTGSTSIEGIVAYPISFIISLAFYGFQVSIIADISSRYSLKTGTIFILGLIYGIFEEGFAIFTMESTKTHTLWLSFAGINITWTIYVMSLHAVITVSITLLIMRVIWPDRISKPFLNRWSYAAMLPVTAVIYVFLMKGAISSGRAPQAAPVIYLIILAAILFLLAHRSMKNDDKRKASDPTLSRNLLLPSLLWGIFLGIPFLVGNRFPLILIPMTVILGAILFYLYRYFWKLDFIEPERKPRIFWATYSVFLAIILILGVFNRTLSSEVIAFSCVAILLYVGWNKVKFTQKYFRNT